MTPKPRKFAACEECEGHGKWFGSPLSSPGPDRWHTCWECMGSGLGREIFEHDEEDEAGDDERV